MAFLPLLAASLRPQEVAPLPLMTLRGGGSATLPQSIVALSGSLVSIGGLASLVEHDNKPARQQKDGPLAGIVSRFEKRESKRSRLSQLMRGAAVLGWGLAKVR